MPSLAAAIADATAAALAGSSLFPDEAVIERSWSNWDMPLADGTFRVDIVPREITSTELLSRTSVAQDVLIIVGIRRKFCDNDRSQDDGRVLNESIDALAELTELANQYMVAKVFSGLASWKQSEVKFLCSHESVRTKGLFYSLIGITFQANTTLPQFAT